MNISLCGAKELLSLSSHVALEWCLALPFKVMVQV